MKSQARADQWKFVQDGLTEDKVPLGTAFPLAMMIAVRREAAIGHVRTELARRGLEVASVDKEWWPFGRRWRVAVRTKAPQPLDKVQIDALLDSLDGALAQHDATVLLWAPIRPAPN